MSKQEATHIEIKSDDPNKVYEVSTKTRFTREDAIKSLHMR